MTPLISINDTYLKTNKFFYLHKAPFPHLIGLRVYLKPRIIEISQQPEGNTELLFETTSQQLQQLSNNSLMELV